MTTTKPATTATKPRTLEIEWADWGNTLPLTASPAVMTKALKKELAGLVTRGAYPTGLRFVRYVGGGLEGEHHGVTVEVSVPDTATALKFYTAYCGGDKEHAFDELVEFYGYTHEELFAV